MLDERFIGGDFDDFLRGEGFICGKETGLKIAAGNPNVLVTHLSDYYGPYIMRYVGTIDQAEALRLNDVDIVYKWAKKFHPVHYFYSHLLTNEQKCESGSGCLMWDVWTAVAEDNPDWRAIPGTPYYGKLTVRNLRKKSLPIAIDEKKVEQWISASAEIPGLYTVLTV